MADSTNNNGVQKTVSLPNVQTSWHNVFDADRNITNEISPVRTFSDGLARCNWTMAVVALSPSGTTTVTAILEGSMDGTNFYTILAPGATTAGQAVTANSTGATPAVAKHFRVRVTNWTQGTAIGYRVQVVVA